MERYIILQDISWSHYFWAFYSLTTRNVDLRADSKTALSLIIPGRISYSRSRLHIRPRRETAECNTVFRAREKKVFSTRAHVVSPWPPPPFLRFYVCVRCEIRSDRMSEQRRSLMRPRTFFCGFVFSRTCRAGSGRFAGR